MSRLIACLSTLTVLSFANHAGAQEPVAGGHNIPRMVEGEALKPAGSFYFGGYSGSREFVPYRVHQYDFRIEGSPADSRAEWVPWAVRVAGAGTQDRRIEWADGRNCTGVYSVEIALSDFPSAKLRTPRFFAPPAGSGSASGPPLVMGAPSLAVWGYANLSDLAFGTMMTTGSDGLIRQWVDFAESRLQDCWSDTPPAGIANPDLLRRLSEIDPTWPAND